MNFNGYNTTFPPQHLRLPAMGGVQRFEYQEANDIILRRREVDIYLHQLANEGIYLGNRVPNDEDFSIPKNRFLTVYLERDGYLYMTTLHPLKGFERRIISAESAQSIKKTIEIFQAQSKKAFEEFYTSAPIFQPSDAEGIRKSSQCNIVFKPNGTSLTVHIAMPMFENGKKICKFFASESSLTQLRNIPLLDNISIAHEIADYLEQALSSNKLVWAEPGKVDDQFKETTRPVFWRDSQGDVFHIKHKDTETEKVSNWSFELNVFDAESEKLEGILEKARWVLEAKPASLFYGLLAKSSAGSVERLIQKVQEYLAREPLPACELPARITKHGSAELGTTLWRRKDGSTVVLPEWTGLKRIARGAYKVVSVAVELTHGKSATLSAWSTSVISDSSEKEATLNEIDQLKLNGEYTEPGARYLLKLQWASPMYSASAKNHGQREKVNKVAIATEYCNEGIFLYENLERLEQNVVDRLQLFRQLLLGVKVLHDHGKIHNDIKPTNILLKRDGFGKPEIRLADFGLLKTNGSSNPCTTYAYLQFELLKKMLKIEGHNKELKVGPYVDIYSLGIICFEAVLGVRYIFVNEETWLGVYKGLEQLQKFGAGIFNVNSNYLEKSKLLQFLSKMTHMQLAQVPQSVDEVLAVVDTVLKDSDELNFLKGFSDTIRSQYSYAEAVHKNPHLEYESSNRAFERVH